MSDKPEELPPTPRERGKKPTPMPRAKSVPNFGDIPADEEDVINHISFNFPMEGRKSDELCEQERNENNDIKQYVINNDYNKEEPIYDNLPVKVETVILPDIIKNKLTQIDNATNEILIRLEEENDMKYELPPIPPKILEHVETVSLIDDFITDVTKENEEKVEILPALQDVEVGSLIDIDDSVTNETPQNSPLLVYYRDTPLIVIEQIENTTDTNTEPVLPTSIITDPLDINLNTDSSTALLEECIAITDAKISDLDENGFVNSPVCEKYQSYDVDDKYDANSDEDEEKSDKESTEEQEETSVNLPLPSIEDSPEDQNQLEADIIPAVIETEVAEIYETMNPIVTRVSEMIPPTDFSATESESDEDETTKNAEKGFEKDDEGIYEAPPPPLPLRKPLIPKEVVLEPKSATLDRTPTVSHHHSLKKSLSSWSITSTRSDTSVKKKFGSLKKFISSKVSRSNSEILLKKKKSSDLIVSCPSSPVKSFVFARPTLDRVDISIRQSGILREVHGEHKIEWRVTLENGTLSWISDWGENSLALENVTSISAISGAGSEWSHGVSLCHVVGSLTEARVRSFSCRSRPERDTWLCTLLGAATAALPATRNLTRAGWLHVKEEAGAAWQPGWMLLADKHVAYCLEGGALRELDLRNDATVVSQKAGDGSETKVSITIEQQDTFLFLRPPNELETSQWEKFLTEATIDRAIEQPGDDVTQEVGVVEDADFEDELTDKEAEVNEPSEGEGEEKDVGEEIEASDSPPITPTLLKTPIARNISASDMSVCVHIEMYASAITMQVAVGPHTTAGEVCTELGRGEDHMLQEFVLGGALARPLHPSERVLEVVMRWADWDLNYRRDNQLVLAPSQIYADSKKLTRPRMTASGKLKIAVAGSKSFRSVWLELSVGAIRLYRKETSSTKLDEWKVDDLVWYLGHEPKRDPGTKWTITFIKKDGKHIRTKDQPYFGTTFGGANKDDVLQWCAALLAATYPEGL